MQLVWHQQINCVQLCLGDPLCFTHARVNKAKFASFRCMGSVRYLSTSTLKSNSKATPVHFVKVDRWSHLDSSGIFFHSFDEHKNTFIVPVIESLVCWQFHRFDFVNVSEV